MAFILASDGLPLVETAPTSVVEQVARLLIQRNCLGSQERLALFGTSKGLAELVLLHVPCTQLSLYSTGAEASSGELVIPPQEHAASSTQRAAAGTDACASAMQGGTVGKPPVPSNRPLASATSQQQATAMRVAACAALDLHLALHGALTLPSQSLWQRITTLSLHHMELTTNTLTPLLHLSRPHNLHTLQLEHCIINMPPTPDTPSNTAHPASLAVRSLHCVQLRCLSKPRTPVAEASALRLVDKAQLRELSTDQRDLSAYLPELPALERLIMPWSIVDDPDLKRILAHEKLTHVCVGRLDLKDDHSAMQLHSLQELEIQRSCSLPHLAALPLSGLNRCTIGSELDAAAPLAEGMEVPLAKVMPWQDKVVCVGSITPGCWDQVTPSFTLTVSEEITVEHMRQLLKLCTDNLHGTLMLSAPWGWTAVDALASLPPTVTIVCFEQMRNLTTDHLFTSLPEHVGHVVLSSSSLSMGHILRLFTGLTRRVLITFYNIYVPGLFDGPASQAVIKAQFERKVRAALASFPNQVQFEVLGDMWA